LLSSELLIIAVNEFCLSTQAAERLLKRATEIKEKPAYETAPRDADEM